MSSVGEKALAKGSTLPPLEKGVLRLFSMRFCPYAQRTRLVLAHKNIKHETINVNLRDKPDWFLERNPLGLVPTVEQDDKIVYESTVCDNYLDEVYPQNKLTPSDPYEKACQQILMEISGKFSASFFKYLCAQSEEEKSTAIQDAHKVLQYFEDALKGRYFGGDDPAMLDFHIWPWFERMEFAEGKENEFVPAEKFPKINAWVTTMYSLPAVKETMFDLETHTKYFISQIAGKPQYDIGLGA